jgi:hypothetical protein
VTAEVAVPSVRLDTSSVSTIWSIGDDGVVDVPAARMAEKIQSVLKGKKGTEKANNAEDKEAESEELADGPYVDVAKEVPGGYGDGDGSELEKSTTGVSSAKSADVEAEAESEAKVEDAEPEAEAQPHTAAVDVPGGFPEEKKAGAGAEEEEESAPAEEPAKKEPVVESAKEQDLPPVAAKAASPVPTSEPVDMALMEEGKDAERREVGL